MYAASKGYPAFTVWGGNCYFITAGDGTPNYMASKLFRRSTPSDGDAYVYTYPYAYTEYNGKDGTTFTTVETKVRS